MSDFAEDPYEVLGVSPDASADEIRRAYRTRIRNTHPDTNHDPGAQEATKRLTRAHELLRDPQRRSAYDADRRREQAAARARREDAERTARPAADPEWVDILRQMAEMQERAEAERQRRARQAEATARAEAERRAWAAQAGAAQQHQAPPPAPAAEPASDRRRSWIAAAAVLALVAALGTIFLVWGPSQPMAEEPAPTASPSGSPTQTTAPPEPQVTVTESTDPLVVQAVADQDAVLDLPTGTWVPQVSSKCEGLGQADLLDARSGRMGYPDGVAEPYPAGLTEEQIDAFHEELAARFGDVMLVSEGASEGLCSGRTIWTSLVADPATSAAGADAWCDAAGLPDAECAARAVNEALLGNARFQEMVVSTEFSDTTVLVPGDASITLDGRSAKFGRGDAGFSVTVFEQALGEELPGFQDWKALMTAELGAPTFEREYDNGSFRLSATFVRDDVSFIYYLGGFEGDAGAIVLLWSYPASEQETWGPAIDRNVSALEAG